MLNYFLQRSLLLALSLVAVCFCLFLLIHWTPNLALERQLHSLQFLGAEPKALSQDIVQFYQNQYPANQDFFSGFLSYIKNFLQLDFGTSSLFNEPVSTIIKQRLPWTLCLGGLTLFLCLLISLALSLFKVTYKSGWLGNGVSIFLVSMWAVPIFVLALTLNNVFKSSFLAALVCMILSHLSLMFFLTQGGVDEELSKAYAQTARAKGLSEKAVLIKHILKNACFPLLTYSASFLSLFVAGSIYVEKIFDIPGLGQLTLLAAEARDLNLLIAIISLQCLFLILGRFLADLIGAKINPLFRKSLL